MAKPRRKPSHLRLESPQLKEPQRRAVDEITEAVTPNEYLGDATLNPDVIDGLQHDFETAPVVLEKIVRAKHAHYQTRRKFISVPRSITDDIEDLIQPSNDWYFHFMDLPEWESWYQVDFDRPYPMTSQQQQRLSVGNQSSICIGWKSGTEVLRVPIVIVRWERNPDLEPSLASGWYYLRIDDEHSGEIDVINLMYKPSDKKTPTNK